jgi:hypothetical protein
MRAIFRPLCLRIRGRDVKQYKIALAVPAHQAERYSAELAAKLRESSPAVEVTPEPSDPEAQDFGATLLLILATPAAVAAAKAIPGIIDAWMKKRRVTIVITNDRGTVRVEADRDDIEAAVATALQ